MANIYEVAELAGVSLATVSRVINPGAKVSDKTREKVLAAMEQLGYKPNSIAQSLATRSSNAVGVLVSELLNHLNAEGAGGIEGVFNKTRVAISRASDGAQVPSVSSSLLDEIRIGG